MAICKTQMMFELITIEIDYNSVENFHHLFSPILFSTFASPARDGASSNTPSPPPPPMCQYVTLRQTPFYPESAIFF